MPRTTGTKADRDAVRLTLESYGAGAATIAGELQRRFGLRPREAFRQARGWTQDQVAARLNASGNGAASFTGARVSDYERWPFGGRRPTLPVLTALGDLYGAAPSALVDLDDLNALPDTDRAVLCAMPGGPTVAVAVAPAQAPGADWLAGDPLRWPAGRLLDEAEVVAAVTERTAAFGAWTESSNVGPLTLDDIAASTRRVAADYLMRPPLEVYARAGLLTDRVFRILQGGHQRRDEEQQLYAWAGYLCVLLAWMAGDLGQLAAAESQARTAWICAERVGDSGQLRGWVLSVMSKTLLWSDRPDEAAATAARGLSLRPGGTASVMLACQEADAWAQLGAAGPARAALTAADQARQAAGDDTVGGLLTCGVVRQRNYAGSVLLRTGAPDAAIGEAELALADAARDRTAAYGTVGQVRIWAAAAHLGAGSVDGAADVVRPVLALPATQRLDTLVRRLRDVAGIIPADPALRTSREARALHAEITEFCATGVARQLPQ